MTWLVIAIIEKFFQWNEIQCVNVISIKASPSSDAWIYVLDTLVVHWNLKSKQPKVILARVNVMLQYTLLYMKLRYLINVVQYFEVNFIKVKN